MSGFVILRCLLEGGKQIPENETEIKAEISPLCCGTLLCTIISKFPYILRFFKFSLHLLALIKLQVFSVNLDFLESANTGFDFPQTYNAS